MSVSEIHKLTTSEIRIFTRLLRFNAKELAFDGQTSGYYDIILDWLGEQCHRLTSGSFPVTLAQPLGLHASMIISTLKRCLPDRWVPPKAVLCESHKTLNPWLIRRIYMQIFGECGVRLTYLIARASEQKMEKEQRRQMENKRDADDDGRIRMSRDVLDWLNRMLSINRLWMTRRQFNRTYPGNPSGNFVGIPLPHEASNCEACILSYIGGNRQILFDLEVSMRGRKGRGEKVQKQQLWPLMEGWKARFIEDKEMQQQAEVLGKKVLHLRKKLQKRRKAKRQSSLNATPHELSASGMLLVNKQPPKDPNVNNWVGELGDSQMEDPNSFGIAELDAEHRDLLDDDLANIGEGHTEKDEREYIDSIYNFYQRLPSLVSLTPASGDAYGTGDYVRPQRFNPFEARQEGHYSKIGAVSHASIGSNEWEDEEVKSISTHPARHPTARQLPQGRGMEDSKAYSHSRKMGFPSVRHTVRPDAPPHKDTKRPSTGRNLSSQNPRNTFQPVVPHTEDLADQPSSEDTVKPLRIQKIPIIGSRIVSESQETEGSRYSKPSMDYRLYETFDPWNFEMEREESKRDSIEAQRAATYQSLVGTLDFESASNPFLDNAYPSPSIFQAWTPKPLSVIQSECSGEEVSVVRTTTSNSRVKRTRTSRHKSVLRPQDYQTPPTRTRTPSPGRPTQWSLPKKPPPIPPKIPLSRSGSNKNAWESPVTYHEDGKVKYPPIPPVESRFNSEGSPSHWSDVHYTHAPHAPVPRHTTGVTKPSIERRRARNNDEQWVGPGSGEQKSKTKTTMKPALKHKTSRTWTVNGAKSHRKPRVDKSQISKPLMHDKALNQDRPAEVLYRPMPGSWPPPPSPRNVTNPFKALDSEEDQAETTQMGSSFGSSSGSSSGSALGSGSGSSLGSGSVILNPSNSTLCLERKFPEMTDVQSRHRLLGLPERLDGYF